MIGHWSRRALLRAGSGALAAFAPGAFATALLDASPETSLRKLAHDKGFDFGTALSTRGLQDENYKQLIQEQCSILVAENEFKMPMLERAPGQFDFARADALLLFAEDAGLRMRGHNLLWHHPRWLPRWLESYDFGADPAHSAEELLVNHVRTVTTHFGTRIHSWDVVNEAVDNVSGEMRETRLSHAMGSADAALELAFRTAREVLPQTELVYNDYMGWEKDGAAHRNGVLKLLERLRRKGVPVNALGIQGHIGADNEDAAAGRIFDARDERAWSAFLREVTGMGYQLLITEFDVHDAPLPADFAKRDREVAALGRAFLDVTLSFREVNAVLCWGLSDKYTWLQGRARRADGLPKRPTPFDDHFEAKPLFREMAAAFRAAPTRPRAAITGQLA
jgi:endo-1,4-beta-xylanase